MMEFHEIANIFPLMQGEEYEALKADIETHGLREPIWLHPDGRIIDGRNRYRACLTIDVAPRFRTWNGQGSLVAFVVSLNLHRRHLTSSQQAALAVEILPMLEAEAKERQRQQALINQPQSRKMEIIPPSEKGKARDHAAALTGTNSRYVSDAKKLKQTASDVFARVVDGTVSLPEAKKLTRLPEQVRDEVLQKIESGEARTVKESHRQVKDDAIAKRMANPTKSETGDCTVVIGDARCLDLGQFDRYGVIVADPPWPYDNPKDHDPRMGGYTYQAMMLSEIKAVPVKALATDNAMLFLWGTWPKLLQVVEVMTAWGFDYITGFPWVKMTASEKPVYGIGSWVAGCSEYVLLGRRGNVSPPNVDNRYLGLVGPALGHSRKPDDVHDIAETLPGPYLELFARRTRPGWTVFGNEIEVTGPSPLPHPKRR